MSARLLRRCGACDDARLRPVLSLGSSPPTCVMVPVGSPQASELHHPLELLVCENCELVQLSVIVDPEVTFPLDYPYSSGNSKALHDNFAQLADQARAHLRPDDLVVDIGANDGTLLRKFDNCRTVGVEPTDQAKRIDGDSYQEFFSERIAEVIVAQHGRAKVVTACNVLAHVADVADVMRGIDVLLADDGVLIAENHDLASVVDGSQWDTVYHEHLRFFDVYSFWKLLDSHGFGTRGNAWQTITTHGGSFRVTAQRGASDGEPEPRKYDFDALAAGAAVTRENIRDVACGIVGIGATARATTIINYCGLDVEDIEYVCEVAGSDKIGRYIPGTRIPVVDERLLFEDQPRRALLFSWHLAEAIVPKLRDGGYRGTVIVPLPKILIYQARGQRDLQGATP